MNISISKADIVWSYFGYILRFCSGLFLLPILLKHFSAEEMGIWYIFIAIGAFVQLIDTGFTPTIMRNVSYAFGGATILEKEGINHSQKLMSGPNYQLIFNLMNVSKKIYFIISMSAILFLLTIGTIYIYIISVGIDKSYIITSWVIYSFSIFFNLYYGYWIAVLTGIGKIEESQKAIIISKLFYLFLSVVGVYFLSYGLIAISLANLVAGVLLRVCCKFYFTRYMDLHINNKVSGKEFKFLFKILWHNSKKMFLISIGGYLITQSIAILCSIFLDLKTTAAYGLTLQLFGVIIAFSTVFLNTNLPLLNEYRVKKNVEAIKILLSINVCMTWGLFISGSLILIGFGQNILSFISSNTNLLQMDMMIFMMVYLLLEINHGLIFGNFILSDNKIPFVPAALGSGFMVVICAVIFLNFTDFGLWGLLISQAFVQLLYNNWKWPLVVLKQLNMNLIDIVKSTYTVAKEKMGLMNNGG